MQTAKYAEKKGTCGMVSGQNEGADRGKTKTILEHHGQEEVFPLNWRVQSSLLRAESNTIRSQSQEFQISFDSLG